MNKICKFYVNKGFCKHENNCKFIHEDNICKKYFSEGSCFRGSSCKFKHKSNKNTECFEPSHELPDMRIIVMEKRILFTERDVIINKSLFDDNVMYNNLLHELKLIGNNDIFKLWHGDTHLIADDHLEWKKNCPIFNMVINKIATAFDMEIKATRFNWYRDSNEWKPYHFDAASVDPKKAESQNLTVGVSFGATRDISFQHATTKTTISIPIDNGNVYAFAKQINVDWRHGIPQLQEYNPQGRISIIAWGKIKDY